MEHLAYELNVAARPNSPRWPDAKYSKDAGAAALLPRARFGSHAQAPPRFRPMSTTPASRNITFDELVAAYIESGARHSYEGGVDI
jgi:hypothetical protein